VGEIDDRRTRNAGEEVFIALRKTNNFVQENRSTNDELVIVEDKFVQADRYILCHQPACDLTHFISGDGANLREISRILQISWNSSGLEAQPATV